MTDTLFDRLPDEDVFNDLLAQVEKALDTIRPYLEADGGNVKVLNITPEYEVVLELLGSCGDCPMSTSTFSAGIEASILSNVKQIKKVSAVNL